MNPQRDSEAERPSDAQIILCVDTHQEAVRGACPVHHGDACLKVYVPAEALQVAEKRIGELERACAKTENEIEAILAEALGYEYSEEYGWVIGDHVALSLADEAKRRIEEQGKDETDAITLAQNHYEDAFGECG